MLGISEVLFVNPFGVSLRNFHVEIDWLRVALAAAQVIDYV